MIFKKWYGWHFQKVDLFSLAIIETRIRSCFFRVFAIFRVCTDKANCSNSPTSVQFFRGFYVQVIDQKRCIMVTALQYATLDIIRNNSTIRMEEYYRLPAFFQNLAALQYMNWYCRLISNLKYLCKILIHYDPQASWIYFINVLLCSDFSRLVGCSGSIFFRDIWDLWSVYDTKSCIEVPQDYKKMLVTY